MSTKIVAMLLVGAILLLLLPKKIRDPLFSKVGRPLVILAVLGALLFAVIPAMRAPDSAAAAQAAHGQEAVAVDTPEVDPACRFWGRFDPIEQDAKGRRADVSGLPNPGQAPLIIYRIEWSCEDCLRADVFYGKASWQAKHSLEIPPGKQGLLYVWYYPERDPNRDENHNYKVTIHSNAENCPKLVVDVPIRYE